MKKCAYCAREIQDGATVCQYCGRELDHKSTPAIATPKQSVNKNSRLALYLLVAIVGVCIIAFGCIWIWGTMGGAAGLSGGDKPPPEVNTPETPYQFVAYRYGIWYVTADRKYNSDRTALESVGRYLCNDKLTCEVWFFADTNTAKQAYLNANPTNAMALYSVNENSNKFEQIRYAPRVSVER